MQRFSRSVNRPLHHFKAQVPRARPQQLTAGRTGSVLLQLWRAHACQAAAAAELRQEPAARPLGVSAVPGARRGARRAAGAAPWRRKRGTEGVAAECVVLVRPCAPKATAASPRCPFGHEL